MKKVLRVAIIILMEIFLVLVIPMVIYADNSAIGVSLHPSFYCLVAYMNLKLFQNKRLGAEGGFILMFFMDSLLSFIYKIIL